jgi:hypothetical protein
MIQKRKLSLWMYGLICIAAGGIAGRIAAPSVSGPLTDQQRGQLMGAGCVTLLAIVIGVILIVVSIVKSIRAWRRDRDTR